MSQPLHRYEGRMFAAEGHLFLVIRVDEAGGIATVSCRMDGRTDVFDMSYAELVRRIRKAPPPLLDNLKGPTAAKRICSEADGWYFRSREGLMGPFASHEEAERGLLRHVLLMQSADGGSRRKRDFDGASPLDETACA